MFSAQCINEWLAPVQQWVESEKAQRIKPESLSDKRLEQSNPDRYVNRRNSKLPRWDVYDLFSLVLSGFWFTPDEVADFEWSSWEHGNEPYTQTLFAVSFKITTIIHFKVSNILSYEEC